MKNFAKIVLNSDGRQALFYIEPENGSFSLHQIVQLNEVKGAPQLDIKVVYNSPDPQKNEAAIYGALANIDSDYADKLFANAMRVIDSLSCEHNKEEAAAPAPDLSSSCNKSEMHGDYFRCEKRV